MSEDPGRKIPDRFQLILVDGDPFPSEVTAGEDLPKVVGGGLDFDTDEVIHRDAEEFCEPLDGEQIGESCSLFVAEDGGSGCTDPFPELFGGKTSLFSELSESLSELDAHLLFVHWGRSLLHSITCHRTRTRAGWPPLR